MVWSTADATAVANSTTETIIAPNVTIPANFMQDGRLLRIRASGAYGTYSAGTMIFTARWGGVSGTVLAKSATVTPTASVGGGASMTAVWDLELYIQTRANYSGTSATLFTWGRVVLHTSTAAIAGTVTNYGMEIPIVSGSTGGTTPAAVAASLDTTADTALALTLTWGTANAANSFKTMHYVLEAMN